MLFINVTHLLADGDGSHEEAAEGAGPGVSLYHVTVPAWLLEDSPSTEGAPPEADPFLTS